MRAPNNAAKKHIMTVSNVTAAQSMVQEATETSAQTKAEAAKGDRQAVRKLAAQEAANPTQNPPHSKTDVDSNRGLLNIKA